MTDTAPEQRAPKAYDADREGARWINRKPTGPEFAEWFVDNVKLPEGLDHGKYVGGIVLIPAVETVQFVKSINDTSGEAVIDRKKQLTYTPYPKVETRLEFYWDLLDENDDWYGVVEPIETPRPSVEPVLVKEQIMDGDRLIERESYRVAQIVQTVEQLPPGFFVMSVPVGGEVAHYLGCSYLVEIRERVEGGDDRVRRSGRGTKAVPMVTVKTWDGRTTIKPDDNAIMKAETGAKGRALGFAGILNIPGSGVATAEDMLEALAGPAAGVQPAEEQAPPQPADQAGPAAPAAEAAPAKSAAEQQAEEHNALIARARELVNEGKDLPGVLEAFKEWGQKRNPPVTNLGNLRGAALRGAIKKLEKLVEAAQAAKPEEATTDAEPTPAAPAEPADPTDPAAPAEEGEPDAGPAAASPDAPPATDGAVAPSPDDAAEPHAEPSGS